MKLKIILASSLVISITLIIFFLTGGLGLNKTNIHAFDEHVGNWVVYEIMDNGAENKTSESWVGYYEENSFIVNAQSSMGEHTWIYSFDEESHEFHAESKQNNKIVKMIGRYNPQKKEFTFKGKNNDLDCTVKYWVENNQSFTQVSISKNEKRVAVFNKRNEKISP